MNREKIKSIALDCGFTVRDGDLDPHVYEFAERLIEPQERLIQGMINMMHLSGYEAKQDSMNPVESWLYDAESVIAEVRGS